MEQSKATVFDVAKYILNKLGEITAMKLEKLAYYCQAWSLVWDDRPLFQERIEAWANGPVIPALFYKHRGMYYVKEDTFDGNIENIDAIGRETIDAVLEHYGDKSSQWLIDLSHSEDPWRIARIGLAPAERGNKEISWDSMADYYSAISLLD